MPANLPPPPPPSPASNNFSKQLPSKYISYSNPQIGDGQPTP